VFGWFPNPIRDADVATVYAPIGFIPTQTRAWSNPESAPKPAFHPQALEIEQPDSAAAVDLRTRPA